MASKYSKIIKKIKNENLLNKYVSNHVLGTILLELPLLGTSQKSLELIRMIADVKAVNRIKKKYKKTAHNKALEINKLNLESKKNNVIWTCWFQGMNSAPLLVQRCYQSLKTHLSKYEIIVITKENIDQYIEFPGFIQEKVDSGQITLTHLSDLIRLELLTRYGGTWIDATVFCSGDNIPSYMLDSELFMFQTLRPGLNGHARRTSSWFMTAHSHHKILELTKELLYEYWRSNNKLIDYYLIHDFIELAIEEYPELWNNVIPFDNGLPHNLFFHLDQPFNEAYYKTFCSIVPFHKLSNKHLPKEEKGTYYEKIILEGE